jgi:hypothetical protein
MPSYGLEPKLAFLTVEGSQKRDAHRLFKFGTNSCREQFPKSVKRFSDKKCDKQRKIEPHEDSIEMGLALAF